MKKISWIWKTLCALLLVTGFSFSTAKDIQASAVPLVDIQTNEYSGQEQFTKVPSGTNLVDINSGVWDNLPAYSCNNLVSGATRGETWCTYKLMWNNEKLFFAVTAKDLTWNDDDMIEISIYYEDQNWGYLFATMAPWVGAGQFNNGSMTFIDFESDETEHTRSIYFSANLKDKSMLREKESLFMNVNYYDYGERVNDEKVLNCRIQSSVSAGGGPSQIFPLVGSMTQETETPDDTLYDYIDDAYADEGTSDNPPDDNPPENPPDDNPPDDTQDGCAGELGVSLPLSLLAIGGIYMVTNKKNKNKLEEKTR